MKLAILVEQYWAFEGIEGYEARRIESLLENALAATDRAACWIAEEGADVTAYLLAVLVLSLEHGGIMAEVDEFFVIPQARGLGTGRALLRHAEQQLGQRGVVRLQLQLGVDNHRARRFYSDDGYCRRSGFELWDKPLS